MVDFTPEEYAAVIGEDQHAFTEETFLQVSPADDYVSNWHVDCIIEHLQAVERGDIRRLIVNIPPRSLKSITIAIAWPAWLLGRDPKRRIICASYGDALAKRHSIDSRLVMESPIYKMAFPETKLASDQNEKGMFMTTQRGFRKATSVGGQILGDGGDFIVCDDLLKADEANSDTVLESTNNWVDQALIPRLNNPATGRIVMVAQRLSMRDPVGHLLDKGGWHHLCLPAEFHKKTIIDLNGKQWVKEEGDLLDPVRLTRAVLDEKQRDLGSLGYAGQYMQSPTPPDGGDFKPGWLQYYNPQAKTFSCQGMNIYILYDPANSKKKASGHDPDYTAAMVLGLGSDNNYYWLDGVRDRLNPTERVQMLINLHKKWNALSGKPPRVVCEQYGMMTDAFYIQQAQKNINYRFSLVSVGGAMRKVDRIRRLVTPFEERRVYIPNSLPYTDSNKGYVDLVESFVGEYETFPVGRHDDMLDAMSRIFEPEVSASFPRLSEATLIRGGEMAPIHEDSRGDWRKW